MRPPSPLYSIFIDNPACNNRSSKRAVHRKPNVLRNVTFFCEFQANSIKYCCWPQSLTLPSRVSRFRISESRFLVWNSLRHKNLTKSDTETGWFMDNETESKQVRDVSKDKSLGISSPMPAFLTWKGIIFTPNQMKTLHTLRVQDQDRIYSKRLARFRVQDWPESWPEGLGFRVQNERLGKFWHLLHLPL